jgi:hypothetical protein
METPLKPGDAVEVKLGDSWLHHIFHSSDDGGVTVTRGGVTRQVAASDVRVPAAVAADPAAPAPASAAAPASDAPTRAEFVQITSEVHDLETARQDLSVRLAALEGNFTPQFLAEFTTLKKDLAQFADVAGKRMDVIEIANAAIGSLTQSVIELRGRIEALETKPAPAAETVQTPAADPAATGDAPKA